MNLRKYIAEIPDFPKPGILFYDIAPLIRSPSAWNYAMDSLKEKISPLKPAVIAGIDARGFLVGAGLSSKMNLGFLMVRKKGKLPGKTISEKYALEYRSDELEIQSQALEADTRVILVDDLLATGGTATASVRLIEKSGAKVVGSAFLIELTSLNGRDAIGDLPIFSLLKLNS
ncbi:MAG: adenine phosphoribosyltransferase [Rhodospirillaceae bacterium]|nr:adenine phosphoribosyltransferase [Rhodospirillaceae bacterium]|tara:strand:+ start:269 stop:787 length:519 start_codon:yes stop_codon:yes gene_type:complete